MTKRWIIFNKTLTVNFNSIESKSGKNRECRFRKINAYSQVTQKHYYHREPKYLMNVNTLIMLPPPPPPLSLDVIINHLQSCFHSFCRWTCKDWTWMEAWNAVWCVEVKVPCSVQKLFYSRWISAYNRISTQTG